MQIPNNPSKIQLWSSYAIQAILVSFFLFGAIANLLRLKDAIDGATKLGIPAESVHFLGALLLLATLLYAIPRTIIVGAILLTSWLGGAVCAHIIHGDTIEETLFPVVFCVLVWLVVYLRSKLYKGFLSPL